MPEDQKSSFSEAVETGASAAHTIRGAIKTGKAISSAAKGAAAGGPYGAVAGAVWAGRKHIGKIIVAVIALLMLPVLFVLMLPGLIFGGLTNAFSPSDPEIPILNSETAIIENANEITFNPAFFCGIVLRDIEVCRPQLRGRQTACARPYPWGRTDSVRHDPRPLPPAQRNTLPEYLHVLCIPKSRRIAEQIPAEFVAGDHWKL